MLILKEAEFKKNEDLDDECNDSQDPASSSSQSDENKISKETTYRRLLSISGTRFIARTRNLRIFKNKLPQIISALKEMGLDVIANSLDGRFQTTVAALYSLLCPISDLSQALQSPELNLIDAQKNINLLLTRMKKLRSEEEFKKLLSQNVSVPTPVPAQVSAPDPVPTEEEDRRELTGPSSKRKRRLPAHLQDSIVMHVMPIMTANDRVSPSLKLQEYFELIDVVVDQLETRFDNPALEALAALQSGKMSAALSDFCKLHRKDPETVERQLEFTAMALLDSDKSENDQIDLQLMFRETKIQRELNYMVMVALTLPVTSSSAERAFSRLRLIKNHLRTTMSSERLQSLLRISANKDCSEEIPLNKMVDIFVKKQRRIAF